VYVACGEARDEVSISVGCVSFCIEGVLMEMMNEEKEEEKEEGETVQ